MKKIIPITAFVAFVLMFTSCKKDYTCTCTITQTGYTPQIVATSIDNSSKDDAQAKCDKTKADFTARGIASECHI